MDNGMYNYGMPSPVMQGYNPYSYQSSAMQRVNNNLPHYEIIRVNGKPGVDAFQMGPNSSVILVDETAPIVWFVRTAVADALFVAELIKDVDEEHDEAYRFWLNKKNTDFDISIIMAEQKDFC